MQIPLSENHSHKRRTRHHGLGLGASIGAYIGGHRKTLLITGDGSFGMNLNELATAVTYKIPVIIVLFNNGVLGMVRQWQSLFFNKHYSATTLDRKTDFVKLAEAFGAKGVRTNTKEAFKAAFTEAYETADGPVVIDCKINEDELVLPMLPPAAAWTTLSSKRRRTCEKVCHCRLCRQ